MFVQFEYAGDKDDSSAIETAEMGQQLQQYYLWACEVVARFGGNNACVNRVLTGDKGNQLHIIFGAPVAPDAPHQASRCALALQRERPPFISLQRVGLTAGKAFAGPVGSSSRCEYTVVGDVVNLSARLTQVSEDDAVLTDKVTADRVRDMIEFEMLPPVKLKGKQEAVSPYKALRDQTTITQLQAYFGRWERPLVGRDEEMALLLDCLAAARGGKGGVVALSGPIGVGKTHLLSIGVKHWVEAGNEVLVGACQQHMTDVPFGPWRTIWRDFLGLQPGMDVAVEVNTVVKRTQALAPQLIEDVGLWEEVVGLPMPHTAALSDLPAEVRQARLFTLMRRCLQKATETTPYLFILEDVHWADQSTLALIDELTQYMESWPVYLALTFRDGGLLPLETLKRPLCTPITLSNLTATDARHLLAKLVGTAKLPQIVEKHLGIRDRDGRDSPVSPLFLEEALNVMIAAGVLEVNGRIRVNEERLSRMQVPDTIHGLLLARLDRLPPPNRDLLQVASVIGRQFSLDPLDTITPSLSRQVIDEMMIALSVEEITRLVTADPEWIYLFQHAMTHEVAYESLPYARRQVLHANVADWLVERYADNLKPLYPVLAYHYTQANNHEKGLQYALAAADEARDIFANKEAVDLFHLAEKHLQALGIEARWETAVDMYLACSESLGFTGDLTAAVAHVEQAIALSQAHQDAVRLMQAYNLMAELRYRQAHYAETQALTQKVIGLQASQSVPSDELARAYQWLGMAASTHLDHELALSNLQKAEKICRQTNNKNRLARVLEAIAYVYYVKRDLVAALEAMQRSVQLSRDFSIPVNIASALNNIALIQSTLGLPQEALQTFDEAIGLLHDANHDNFLAHFLTNRAVVYAYLGQFPLALNDFEEAINHFVAMDDEYGMVEAYSLWGYEYSNVLHNWQEAHYQFEQAQQLISQRPDDYPEERVRVLLGCSQMELRNGSVEAVKPLLDVAEAVVTEKELLGWQPVVAYFRGLYYAATHHINQAQTWFERGVQAVEQGGFPDYLPLLLLELAQLETDPGQKESYLIQCVQSARQRARYSDRVTCFKVAGALLAQSEQEQARVWGQLCLEQIAIVSE